MGKRILAICCTPYQLLVAAQVLACYYPGEEADLILSDQMSGARKLWEQAKDIWPYGQVYYLEERRLNRLAHVENAKNILLGAVAPEKLLELCASCEQQSTHPIAASIVAAANSRNLELRTPESLEELPGMGIRAVLDGEEIDDLRCCYHWWRRYWNCDSMAAFTL